MSVALRTITRLQDADDINVSLGVGVDEYALVYDHDTAKFVLRAMSVGVTDHGALTGLTDDDHTGYLLATGARTGASSQAQTFTNGIVGPTWKPASDSTTALQLQNAAGGASIIVVDTTNNRVGVNTTPAVAFHAVGQAQFDATWASNVVSIFVRNTAGVGIGAGAGVSLYGDTNDYLGGVRALYRGGYNDAGRDFDIFSGGDISTPKVTVKGNGYFGVATTLPSSLLHALLTDANTNTVVNVVTIGHNTSGTVDNGFGSRVLWELESSTTADQSAAALNVTWYDATHATRKADLVLTAYDSGGEREGLRIRGNGSAAAIGFLGATPATRQAHVADPSGGATVDSEARSAINLILATLETFGLHATS